MSELTTIVAESVNRLFADHAGAAREASLHGWQSALWEQCVNLGLPLTLVPESGGGLAGDWQTAFEVLYATGFHQIPLPIAESMLAARLCGDAGLQLPDGVLSVSPYPTEWNHESGNRFTVTLRAVPWGRNSDFVVTSLTLGGQPHVAILNSRDAALVKAVNLAGEPRDTMHFHDTNAVVAICDTRETRSLLDFCALSRLAQIAGCLESALSQSVNYARERKQFGRAIGQFQAVQQQLALFGADSAAAVCAARAACLYATLGDAGFQIAAAKLRANMAIGVATSISHQVHAAIGFTFEFPLHHATQRLWSWRSELGNDKYWSERIGRHIAMRGPDSFWSDLTAPDAVELD
jgi:acyl-CoA dehydrogenase